MILIKDARRYLYVNEREYYNSSFSKSILLYVRLKFMTSGVDTALSYLRVVSHKISRKKTRLTHKSHRYSVKTRCKFYCVDCTAGILKQILRSRQTGNTIRTKILYSCTSCITWAHSYQQCLQYYF